MSYVEGAFADQKFKRRAVMVLAAVSVVSFADGLVRRAGWVPTAEPADALIGFQQAALPPTAPAPAPLQVVAAEPAPAPAPVIRKVAPVLVETPATAVEGVDAVASAPAAEEVRAPPDADDAVAATTPDPPPVESPAEASPPVG
jgi:hypothetical protein